MIYAQVKLGDVANVQLGFTLRGENATQHDPQGTHRLIRISDIRETGALTLGHEPLVALDEATAERAALVAGDVLVIARGARLTAAAFSGEVPAIAGNQFCVVRPLADRLDSLYLRFFLNLPATQNTLLASSRGTHLPAISARMLAELELPLPPLERQAKFGALDELRLQEAELRHRLDTKRGYWIHQTLQHALLGD